MSPRCKKKETPVVSLRFRGILYCLFWFGILTLFMLGHVFLRFTIRDLKVEAVYYQTRAEEIKNQEKMLTSDIASLKEGDRLREFAVRDLGLKDVKPFEIEKLTVPATLIAEYEGGGSRSGYSEIRWAKARHPGGLREEVNSFVEINREIFAREENLEKSLLRDH